MPGPGIESPFFLFPAAVRPAVGIKGAGKGPSLHPHFIQQKGNGAAHGVFQGGGRGLPPDLGSQAQEGGIDVEHLFEMRHLPRRIDRIAVKTAADMVIEAARDHAVQGGFDDGAPGRAAAP